MRTSFLGLLLALTVALLPGLAFAQRVVVLELDGDRSNKLRDQIETALRKAGTVELVSIKRYREMASKKHLRGSKAYAPAGAAQVAKGLPFEAAVGGYVTDTLSVHIYDFTGAELWTRDVPIKGGLLSGDNVRRLTKAITAAAQAAPQARAVEAGGDAESPETPPVESDAPVIRGPGATRSEPAASAMPAMDVSKDEAAEAAPAPASTDSDLEAEGHRRSGRVAPPLLKLELTGTTTFRSYCARPGVTSCHDYDITPNPTTVYPGPSIDFAAGAPYLGGYLDAEAFPFQSFDSIAKGLGLEASYSRGYCITSVVSQPQGGGPTTQQVMSVDQRISGMLLARYYFGLGSDKAHPLVGHVGLRGGLETRTFDVDPSAGSALPGSHRVYPAFGLQASVPIIRQLALDGAASYYLNPHAGVNELAGFGASVSSTGFGLEVGVSGEVYGPFGYHVSFKYQSFKDEFTGTGQEWTQGGVAEESYAGIFWGATAHF